MVLVLVGLVLELEVGAKHTHTPHSFHTRHATAVPTDNSTAVHVIPVVTHTPERYFQTSRMYVVRETT